MNLVEALNQNGDMKLCFIKGPWAWFTSITDLSRQYGTDWNNTYENAGPPNAWSPWMEEEEFGIPTYRIIKIAFTATAYKEPILNRFFKNEPITANDLHRGRYPWLAKEVWSNGELERIMAGTTLREFTRLITEDGGHIYMEM